MEIDAFAFLKEAMKCLSPAGKIRLYILSTGSCLELGTSFTCELMTLCSPGIVFECEIETIAFSRPQITFSG